MFYDPCLALCVCTCVCLCVQKICINCMMYDAVYIERGGGGGGGGGGYMDSENP